MNKSAFDSMVAQYAVQDISGEGAASWDNGVRCVLPEVLIGGKAVQNGTPTPDAPIMPEFSSGTEVVSRGKNLFDVSNGEYKFFGGEGTVTVSDGRITFDGSCLMVRIFLYDACKPGESLTLSLDLIELSDSADSPVIPSIVINYESGRVTEKSLPVQNPGRYTVTVTSKEDELIKNVELRPIRKGNNSSTMHAVLTNVQLELGTTATPYEPYFDGGSATAPELLAIPGTDIRDEWNPQTGKGVRRVGVQTFDGTEKWYGYWATSVALENWCGRKEILHYHNKRPNFLCNVATESTGDGSDRNDLTFVTHWELPNSNWIAFHCNMTLTQWKAYLAAQYAAATPVTVWYALKEPIEFQADPAPLMAPKGAGHIMQVGGTLDAVPITAKYVTHS